MREFPIGDQKYQAVLTAFTAFLRNTGYGKGSLAGVPSMVREFLHRMERQGIWRLDLIGPQEVQAHYQYLCTRRNIRRAGGLSSHTLAHHLFALRTFFAWLVRLEAIVCDPLAGLDLPRPAGGMRTALDEAEVRAMYDRCATAFDRALLGIYYGCGLRRQEGTDLNVEDLDLTTNRLIVRAGKYARRREVPFPPRVADDLGMYLRGERPLRLRLEDADGRRALLLNSRGRRISGWSANKRVHDLAVLAAIGPAVDLHRLRHSIATHMKERGMAMEAIRQFLGHGSLDVTQAYITGYRLHWRKETPHHHAPHGIRRLPEDPFPSGDGGALYKSTWRFRSADR